MIYYYIIKMIIIYYMYIATLVFGIYEEGRALPLQLSLCWWVLDIGWIGLISFILAVWLMAFAVQ